jgi:hypothetical protein
MPKVSFCEAKVYLWQAKMGIFRTILRSFWTKEKCPKICKRRFPLIIKHLVKGLKTRVFETDGGVGGFQMLIFDFIVKIIYQEFKALFSSHSAKTTLCLRSIPSTHCPLVTALPFPPNNADPFPSNRQRKDRSARHHTFMLSIRAFVIYFPTSKLLRLGN